MILGDCSTLLHCTMLIIPTLVLHLSYVTTNASIIPSISVLPSTPHLMSVVKKLPWFSQKCLTYCLTTPTVLFEKISTTLPAPFFFPSPHHTQSQWHHHSPLLVSVLKKPSPYPQHLLIHCLATSTVLLRCHCALSLGHKCCKEIKSSRHT